LARDERETPVRFGSVAAIVLVLWLLIGAAAAGQRGYLSSDDKRCTAIGTTMVTILTGPLNYTGANPVVEDCDAPEPSK
jgi:hypothetical protein